MRKELEKLVTNLSVIASPPPGIQIVSEEFVNLMQGTIIMLISLTQENLFGYTKNIDMFRPDSCYPCLLVQCISVISKLRKML